MNAELLASRSRYWLLTLAVLPLFDGFYLAWLSSSLWNDPVQAIAFGLTAFSGAGCVVAAMQLPGSWLGRALYVVSIYLLVALLGASIAIGRTLFESILPDNLHLFTAIFLIGLGLTLTEHPTLTRIASLTKFDAVLPLIIVGSVLQAIFQGVSWVWSFDTGPVLALLTATAAGFLLTLLGCVGGLRWGPTLNLRALNGGAGISLGLMGCSLLGLQIESMWVLLPLLLGVVVAFVARRT